MPLPIPRSLAAGLVLLTVCGSVAAQAGKADAPIPAATLALMAQKGTSAAAPVLFRAYKKESEIEVWKKGPAGYVHIKTFPICRWSGQLGPKRKSGDRQTPEGFYSVPRRQMNPNSHYYLSFDVGYPNAYDRAHGGTGSAVMVHGICSSMGCFAMTDGTVGEIYAIAREALNGGQAAFQFQSYPFRMSAENMARHRTDPNIGFWRELKAGSDRFEASKEELQVSVVAGRYAFAPSRDPAREAAVATHRAIEEARMAALAESGEPAVRTTYSDGGQHAFWAAYTARGGAVGDVSRPEALAFAGQEVVVVPGHRAPRPVPEAVWAAWAAPDSALALRRMAGFVPVYDRAPDPFGALAGRLPARYGDGLPAMLAAGLGWAPGAVGGPLIPGSANAGLVASAARF
ncbi:MULTISPECIES: murein L,D-transpeptidase family protein [unclassified Methylobacterium]|uniref:L,D-transpeptidase family protein n=1 Tax=unclassified Methylobacterium TaxID=2615210 RepID=UPI0011C1F7F4|nr:MULTISPECIES: murein L,D-transpeptidase family protein [unclassified Methylobacterium]QEE38489.1 murein L,D-transpeptidase [Methylobacterium sp. WL1]TXN56525.1 murein L,D-transpeptidase [Methylobacterium sp. WL2]